MHGNDQYRPHGHFPFAFGRSTRSSRNSSARENRLTTFCRWQMLINSGHGQNSLQYSAEANEHHEQFEQVGKAPVCGELVDGPKADCADDNDSQNGYQN
jgi:hypothetical protein